MKNENANDPIRGRSAFNLKEIDENDLQNEKRDGRTIPGT
jgi:hypothetical protein